MTDMGKGSALWHANNIIESLRQQLDQTIEECAKKLNEQGKQLAECQAREKMLIEAIEVAEYALSNRTSNQAFALNACVEALAMPSDSTALDTLKKQWEREALLEGAKQLKTLTVDGVQISYWAADHLEYMAKELE